MTFKQPKLKYAQNALEPYISEDTIAHHYGKHEKKYFEKTNELIKGTVFDKPDITLDELVRKSSLLRIDKSLFNNACQAWNHVFYFDGLTSHDKQGAPHAELKKAIEASFDSVADFKKELLDEAAKLFGSGWAWVVLVNGKVAIKTTSDADNPLNNNGAAVPLLVIDVWEHAYYLDTQNERDKYLKNIWNVIDWNVVNARYDEAK